MDDIMITQNPKASPGVPSDTEGSKAGTEAQPADMPEPTHAESSELPADEEASPKEPINISTADDVDIDDGNPDDEADTPP
jgi:hypothetical protein